MEKPFTKVLKNMVFVALVTACNTNESTIPKSTTIPDPTKDISTQAPPTQELPTQLAPLIEPTQAIEMTPTPTSPEMHFASVLHSQKDPKEYITPFKSEFQQYFAEKNITNNFCGPAVITTILEKYQHFPTTISQVVNEYFREPNGEIIPEYIFASDNGAMSAKSVYNQLKQIGIKTNLWQTTIMRGNPDLTEKEPLKKAEINNFGDSVKNVIDQGGLVAVRVSRNTTWGSDVKSDSRSNFFHYSIIADVKKDEFNNHIFLIVDPLSFNQNESDGIVSWVTADDYSFPVNKFNPEIFTGFYEAFSIIPNNQ